MLTETVTYKDYNNIERTEVLNFNINETDISDNLALVDRAARLRDMIVGPEREVTTAEKQEILDLVKSFMKLAYGVRSADGSKFYKSEEAWNEFRATNAYNTYLLSLFQNPEKAFGFIVAVCPPDTGAKVEQAAREEHPQLFDTPAPTPQPATDEDTRPAWIREDREPTNVELQNMSREEILEAMRRKTASNA